MVRFWLIDLTTILLVTMRNVETVTKEISTTMTAVTDVTDAIDNSTDSAEELHQCNPGNPDFNCSEMDFVRYTLGPQRINLNVTVPITILYVAIFLTGVVGNMAVCAVIIKNPTMHSATNYYLFSLAISDLTLLLFGLPNDLSYYWHQYPYKLGIGFCKLRALLSEATSYVSVLTIVAFSMERYLAICHPLHLYAMSGLKRAVRIIAALWIISILAAAPFALHTTIHYITYPPNSLNATEIPESAFCAMLGQPQGWPVWEMSSIIFFLLPAVVIMLLYTRMGLKIRSRHGRRRGQHALNGINGSVHGEARQAQSRKAIIRMLAAVVIAFFVCWAPFHAQRLLYIYGQNWEHFQDINEWMFSITGWLYYVSSTVNPILYNVMSKRYRVAFKETLCCGRRMTSSNGGGFSQHSSFRETTIKSDTGQLIRVRSVVASRVRRAESKRYARHSSPPSIPMPHHVSWKEADSMAKLLNIPEGEMPLRTQGSFRRSIERKCTKKKTSRMQNIGLCYKVRRKRSLQDGSDENCYTTNIQNNICDEGRTEIIDLISPTIDITLKDDRNILPIVEETNLGTNLQDVPDIVETWAKT